MPIFKRFILMLASEDPFVFSPPFYAMVSSNTTWASLFTSGMLTTGFRLMDRLGYILPLDPRC